MTKYKVLFQHLPGVTERTHGKYQSIKSVDSDLNLELPEHKKVISYAYL